jgi:hypothetical protein
MAKGRSGPCVNCGRELSASDFSRDRAMVLLGRAYCLECLEARTLSCHICKQSLRKADFVDGRAFTLLGWKYCGGCLDAAVQHARGESRKAPPAVPTPAATPKAAPPLPSTDTAKIPVVQGDSEGESRRMYSRFVPPAECELALKPGGLRGLFGTSVLRLWVDVSEGGLRAVVDGKYEQGEGISGRMSYPPLRLKLEFKGEVRHCKPSEKYAGCYMIGLKFQNPSSELKSFIREVMGDSPAMMSMKPAPPRRSAPKTEVPGPSARSA